MFVELDNPKPIAEEVNNDKTSLKSLQKLFSTDIINPSQLTKSNLSDCHA